MEISKKDESHAQSLAGRIGGQHENCGNLCLCN